MQRTADTTMTQKLNIDNGLQAQRTERQHLTLSGLKKPDHIREVP